MKNVYGLIGRPLGHSFSKKFFTEKFEKENIDAEYLNFELASIDDLKDLIANTPDLKGLNVTIPYKQDVIPFLDYISPCAEEIGAVNCIKMVDGKLYGYNTDYLGFKLAIERILDGRTPKALILGTGGAAQAVKFALMKLGITFQSVSRNKTKDHLITYSQLNKQWFDKYKLIINTTPLGTTPNIDTAPDIPYEYLTEDHILYDLVYNPARTKFLSQGRVHGAATSNGSLMLISQAMVGWEIWQHHNILDVSKFVDDTYRRIKETLH